MRGYIGMLVANEWAVIRLFRADGFHICSQKRT